MLRTTIYILELEHGRYYVGKTDNVGKRFHEHMTGKGSSWTRKYKPVSIEKSIPNCSPFDEDKYVKECMAKYGIKNVRGGSYVTDELNDFQIDSLKKEIWNAKNCCLRCGHNNHFVKDCFASSDIDGDLIRLVRSNNFIKNTRTVCYSPRNNVVLASRESPNKTANDAALALRLQMQEWAIS
jgi:hypothetical protein